MGNFEISVATLNNESQDQYISSGLSSTIVYINTVASLIKYISKPDRSQLLNNIPTEIKAQDNDNLFKVVGLVDKIKQNYIPYELILKQSLKDSIAIHNFVLLSFLNAGLKNSNLFFIDRNNVAFSVSELKTTRFVYETVTIHSLSMLLSKLMSFRENLQDHESIESIANYEVYDGDNLLISADIAKANGFKFRNFQILFEILDVVNNKGEYQNINEKNTQRKTVVNNLFAILERYNNTRFRDAIDHDQSKILRTLKIISLPDSKQYKVDFILKLSEFNYSIKKTIIKRI
ncbi:MAG: hypothetical protein WCK31_04580 [bacterium]